MKLSAVEVTALEWLVDNGGDESEYSIGVVADLIEKVRRETVDACAAHLRKQGNKWNDRPFLRSSVAREQERFAGRMLLTVADDIEKLVPSKKR